MILRLAILIAAMAICTGCETFHIPCPCDSLSFSTP